MLTDDVVSELQSLRANWSAYHNHKETVAYTAMAAIFALGGYHVQLQNPTKPLSVVCVLALIIAHVFLRIQLMRRSNAAILQRAITRAIEIGLSEKDPKNEHKATKRPGWGTKIFMYFWPLSAQHFFELDRPEINEPSFVRAYTEEIEKFDKRGFWVHKDALLLSVTSLAVIVICIAHAFFVAKGYGNVFTGEGETSATAALGVG